MQIRITKEPLSKKELIEIAEEGFGDLVKAVVDIEKGLMAIGGELHAFRTNFSGGNSVKRSIKYYNLGITKL